MHLQYGEVRQAHFLERPNRFIAHVELEGETVVCHVKNTGRCRELLVRGATVYLERGTNPARRTAWDLIAVEQGHIRFLLAYRGCRAVGMCSVAENFSTFCCGPVAVLEDLYVEPVFRRQGIARQLTRSAQALCRERGVGSLTVCCAPCDEAMYQALGFNVPLGVSRSCLL